MKRNNKRSVGVFGYLPVVDGGGGGEVVGVVDTPKDRQTHRYM